MYLVWNGIVRKGDQTQSDYDDIIEGVMDQQFARLDGAGMHHFT